MSSGHHAWIVHVAKCSWVLRAASAYGSHLDVLTRAISHPDVLGLVRDRSQRENAIFYSKCLKTKTEKRQLHCSLKCIMIKYDIMS